MDNYLTEAFRQLNLTEDVFSLDTDEGVAEADAKLNEEPKDIELEILDSDAEDETEIKDSYIGNVIIECPVCHQLQFKEPDEIDLDGDADLSEEIEKEEDVIVNCGEECPTCLSDEGFKLIGQISPYKEFDVSYEIEDEEDFDEDDDIEDDEDEDEEDDNLEENYIQDIPEDRDNGYDLDDDDEDEDEEDEMENRGLIRDRYNPKNLKESLRKSSKRISTKNIIEAHNKNALLRQQYVLNKMFESANPDESKESFEEYPAIARPSLKSEIWGKNEALEEGFNNVDVSTDTEKLTMSQDPTTQKVTVTTEPLVGDAFSDDMMAGDEFISPLQDDMIDEIETNNADEFGDEFSDEDFDFDIGGEEGAEGGEAGGDESDFELEGEEAPEGGEEFDLGIEETPEEELGKEESFYSPKSSNIINEGVTNVDFDYIDEKSFDRLGESYLKNVYDNVLSFQTSNVSMSDIDNKLIVEGVIMFDSGNRKNTKFVFEGKSITKDSKLKFIGENANITRGKKSFGLVGKVSNGELISESLTYKYKQDNKVVRGKETIR